MGMIAHFFCARPSFFFFFFNDTATTEIYTLSLHDALPILERVPVPGDVNVRGFRTAGEQARGLDRKSTRLNSSHLGISYAVFCLKKKKQNIQPGIDDLSNYAHSALHRTNRASAMYYDKHHL